MSGCSVTDRCYTLFSARFPTFFGKYDEIARDLSRACFVQSCLKVRFALLFDKSIQGDCSVERESTGYPG
jgi:hypothetical protein